jgi:carboxypeptidase PM20D1
MCKHALCDHAYGELKPIPPSVITFIYSITITLIITCTLFIIPFYLLPWLPNGTLLTLILLTVSYLFIRAYTCESFQLSNAELTNLSQSSVQFEWNVKGQRDRLQFAQRLGQAIRIRTVSHDRPEKKEESEGKEATVPAAAPAASASSSEPIRQSTFSSAFLELHQLFQRNYPLVHQHLELTLINNYSLLYRWRSNAPTSKRMRPFLLTAHLDVVPATDGHLWSADSDGPFSGKLLNEQFVCGRGAIDDKQSVCGILEAIETLLSEGMIHPTLRDIFVAFGHDEEISGYDGAAEIAIHIQRIFEEERLFDNKVPPFSFLLDEGLFVMDGMVPGVRQPVAMVCVAEKGFLLSQLTVSVPAHLAGHASTPQRESAIGILSRALNRLESSPMPTYFPRGSPARLMFESVAAQATFPMKILFANLHIFSPILKFVLSLRNTTATLIRTTTALTVFKAGSKGNQLPREALALVNHRIHPLDSVAGVLAYSNSVINDSRVQVKDISSLPPAPVSSHMSEGFRIIQRALGRVMPEVLVAPALMVGATDTHWYKHLAEDIYRFTPTRMNGQTISMFHGANERIQIDNYVETIGFYRAIIQLANENDK